MCDEAELRFDGCDDEVQRAVFTSITVCTFLDRITTLGCKAPIFFTKPQQNDLHNQNKNQGLCTCRYHPLY